MTEPVSAGKGLRVCLVGLGSAGDVHPLLALGRVMAARGHPVTILTNPAFAAAVDAEGLDFAPVGSVADYEATIAHLKLWHPVDGLGVMWRYLLRPALEPTYREIARLADAGPCVVAATPVAMGARVAQEHLGVPLVTLYTAATMLRTTQHPMTLAHWQVPSWVPGFVRRGAWALLDRHKLEPLVRPALAALRASLGLPPLRQKVFAEWMHSPESGVALFPEWFARAPSDWPGQVVQAGFPLFDERSAGLPADLERFLRDGPAPVVFMPGTGRRDPEAFFHAAVRACRSLGVRGVLLGRVPPAQLVALPDGLHAQPYTAFGALLRHARALVHHGGIGTSAQGLRAGLPQLVAPLAYDQFDNAMRLEHLGVGRRLPTGDRGLARMGRLLGSLLDSTTVRLECSRWSAKTNGDAAARAIVRAVERFA